MASDEGWHELIGGVKIPMPPKDLLIALATVLMFLPAVVLATKCVTALLPRGKPVAKQD